MHAWFKIIKDIARYKHSSIVHKSARVDPQCFVCLSCVAATAEGWGPIITAVLTLRAVPDYRILIAELTKMAERNVRLASCPAHHAPSGSTCWQPIKGFSVERDVSASLQSLLILCVLSFQDFAGLCMLRKHNLHLAFCTYTIMLLMSCSNMTLSIPRMLTQPFRSRC